MCDSPTTAHIECDLGSPESAQQGQSRSQSGGRENLEASLPTFTPSSKPAMPHPSTETRRPAFPPPVTLPWSTGDSFWHSNGAATGGLSTPDGTSEPSDGMLQASFSFDGASDDAPPATPVKRADASYLIRQGLMTPPETPRHEIAQHELHESQREGGGQSVFDPFTPPATPGDARHTFDYTFKAGIEEQSSPSSRTKTPQRVRFASPARSEVSDTGSFHSCSASNELDDDDDDNASTISTLEDYGLERHCTPETSPEPEPEPAEEPEKPRTEFEELTRFLPRDRIPKPARLACAQCLRLGLPCNRAMPECSRCLRRRAQHEAHALSPAAAAAASPADACCVPMLRVQDYYGNTRPIPIFLAHSDDMLGLPWWADEGAARAALEARRRAAYAAIVAEDAGRAARANWALPRPGADALGFRGRAVVDRLNAGPVLRRDVGVDGPCDSRRAWERV